MIVFLILIIILWLISKKSEKVRFWKEKIIRQPLNYYLLLGLLVVGFLFRLDYTKNIGCFVSSEPIFELRNILFSATSITLVLLSLFSKKRTIKLTLISLELFFWISKLFLFKGGYSVGIANVPDPIISLYDTTTLALRFFIINSLLNTNISKCHILIGTIIVISIKIFVSPLPHSFIVAQRRLQIASENTQNFLRGKWIENRDATDKIKIIFLPPEGVIIYNFRNQESLFFDDVWYGKDFAALNRNWGDPRNPYSGNLEVQKIGNDTISVNFRLGGIIGEVFHKTQMIRVVDSHKYRELRKILNEL